MSFKAYIQLGGRSVWICAVREDQVGDGVSLPKGRHVEERATLDPPIIDAHVHTRLAKKPLALAFAAKADRQAQRSHGHAKRYDH
eukprot:m.63922 g.63922  ORF g.63922 m.63922 type:complete len:85 (-) comp7225_c0_seq1:2-256(-)